MIRRIIEINEEKCNGCGACAAACHESAIGMVNGKAKLLRDDYCDGLGDCLPQCPTGAIKFVEREAAEYDEAAVLANKKKKEAETLHGCPGSRAMRLKPMRDTTVAEPVTSGLAQWPCQIKLVPVSAPYFEGADLLIAADCTAYAYANFHQEFMRGRITLIGCPKLDAIDYSEKLAEIIREKVLLLTEEEVPHSVAVVIERIRKNREHLIINAMILVERDSQKGIIIGKQGRMIKQIGTLAREELQGLLGEPIFLELFVRVEKDWRNKKAKLQQLGYIQTELEDE